MRHVGEPENKEKTAGGMCPAEADIRNASLVPQGKRDEETGGVLVRVPEVHGQRRLEKGDQRKSR